MLVCVRLRLVCLLKCSRISHNFAIRNVTRYNAGMIKSFRHKGIKLFFESGSKAGIQASHAAKLARQLSLLNSARSPEEMNLPGWRFHPLSHNLKNHYAVWVDQNWRLTFSFEAEDAELVDYQDYH